jgi:hypothetical protein
MEIKKIKPNFCNDINLNDIVYSNINLDRDGKKTIYVYNKEVGNKLYVQTPELSNILNVIKNKNYNELNIPLHGKKTDKINNFVHFLRELDAKIINDAKKNKNEWFNNNTKIKYRSLIKNIHDDYIETIEYKSGMFENGIIKFKLTNSTVLTCNNENISVNEIKTGNSVRTIFQVFALWISNDLFGLYLKPIKIDQIIEEIVDIDFINLSENDTVYNTDIDNASDDNNSNDTISDSESSLELKKNELLDSDNYMNEKYQDIQQIQNIEQIFEPKNNINDINEENLNNLLSKLTYFDNQNEKSSPNDDKIFSELINSSSSNNINITTNVV